MAGEHYHDRADRVFVRGVSGAYSLKEELQRLRSLPRVIRPEDRSWTDGPQAYSRHYLEPGHGLGQSLHIHLEEYAPGASSQQHGHVNEAVFYILDGRGYEIHDGQRYDWEAGDVVVVHNACVHQHFNADPDRPARALVLKTKPMFMFMGMFFQHTVKPRPKEAPPGQERFVPREENLREKLLSGA